MVTRWNQASTGSASRKTGLFNLFPLKVIQEVITLTVFTLCAVFVFKSDTLRWNHLVGFALLIAAVYVIFRKW
ncbi:DMT family protein [Hymenobacter sp. CRA2]|uniref:DMT family protein n=1 Tax=Hymenobacter sp. CRA2 TaxID=1955620 RepID=UPI0020C97416|nr:DMT family protein [Hymenobacter sp. CRA2]